MRIRCSTDYRALDVVCSVSFFVPCFIMSLNVLISLATKKQRGVVFVILLNRTRNVRYVLQDSWHQWRRFTLETGATARLSCLLSYWQIHAD